MRPGEAVGSLGELQGKPETVIKNVPCSIKTLSGNEQESARQNGVTATLAVEMYGDPNKPLKEKDWLEFGSRKLNIAHIEDVNQNGLQLKLLCGESK
jgi:head-tail adaptor